MRKDRVPYLQPYLKSTGESWKPWAFPALLYARCNGRNLVGICEHDHSGVRSLRNVDILAFQVVDSTENLDITLSLAKDNGSSKFLRGRTGSCFSTLFLSKSSDRISPELWVVLFLLIRNRTLNGVLLRYITDMKSKQLFSLGTCLSLAPVRYHQTFAQLYFPLFLPFITGLLFKRQTKIPASFWVKISVRNIFFRE